MPIEFYSKQCFAEFYIDIHIEIIELAFLQSEDILLAAPSPTHVPHSDAKLDQSDALNYNGDVGIWSRSQSIRVKSNSVQSSFRFSDSGKTGIGANSR